MRAQKSVLFALACIAMTASAWVPTVPKTNTFRGCLYMSDASESPPASPTTFREAEVLGLRLMQEGKYEDALGIFEKGLKLPGSRPDIVRTKRVSGPSPVGGSAGGTDSETVMSLDEFELQAAHYNMACAHAQMGNAQECLDNLKLAFDNGFDNYAAVRGDPDLSALQGSADFDALMDSYTKKEKLNLPKFDLSPSPPSIPNPFLGLFGKK